MKDKILDKIAIAVGVVFTIIGYSALGVGVIIFSPVLLVMWSLNRVDERNL